MFVTTIPEEVFVRFSKAWSICILTGAGISVESGIATFRGPGSNAYFEGWHVQHLYSHEAWQHMPARVNQFLHAYRYQLEKARPGLAHQTLHAWETKVFAPHPPFRFTLLTQNIDGLHQLMGNKQVIELHGSIWRLRCSNCEQVNSYSPFSSWIETCCSMCNGLLRPDVVLENEYIAQDQYWQAINAAQWSTIFISIGVSGTNHFANKLAEIAKQKNSFLIEINPRPTYISHLFDITILGYAEDILPQFPWDHHITARV